MLELYPDQMEVVEEVRNSMRRYKNVLLQAATGFGKTRIAEYMIKSAISKGNRVVFTVPRKVLLEQTSDTFECGGINHSYIAAGKQFNPYSQMHIGMIDTMARRLDNLPKANIIFIDEAHFGDGNLTSVIDHYKKQGSWIVGLSASPWKLSGKGLGCYYDHMVCGKPVKWLIENKRLSDYKYFGGRTHIDFDRARVSGGEYNQSDIDGIIEANEKAIIGDAIKDYKEKSMGRLHLSRCVSIKRSEILAQSYRDAGIPAMHVDGDMDKWELKKILTAYARREILVVTFCDLLNFGFDLAQISGLDVCVESGDDQKPSMSLAGQTQWWGRLLRKKDFPANIFDRVNNWTKHGFPCSDREWTLADREQSKKASAERTVPTRQCSQCFFVHTPSPICPECGHVYEIKSRDIDEMDGDLIEIDKDAMKTIKKGARMEQGRAETLDDLIALGRRKGYKSPSAWAARVLAGRMMKNARN